MTKELTPQQIREAGGLVHSDGNVFFTRAAQLRSLIDSAIAADRALRAREYPALPDALKIIWPTPHSVGLSYGVEDRNIHDRYEAAEYGFKEAIDRSAMCVPEQLFEAGQMHTYAAQAVEAYRALQDASHAEELAAYDHTPWAR